RSHAHARRSAIDLRFESPDSGIRRPMTSPSDVLAGKHILLGVSGSIAAFKAVALASELTKCGALVDVLLTRSANQFVTPLSFSAITHRSVTSDVFSSSEHAINHVSLGASADAFIVAPAT